MASGRSYSHTSKDYSIASDTCYRNVSWKKIEKKQDEIFSFGQKERNCAAKQRNSGTISLNQYTLMAGRMHKNAGADTDPPLRPF